MAVAYIVFDLDGTLCDPLVGIASSINYALTQHGYAEQTNESLKAFIGPPLEHIFTTLTPCESEAELASMIRDYRQHYAEKGYHATTIYEGIKTALQDLKSADIPLAVCTLKQTPVARDVLKLLGIDEYFDHVWGRSEEPNKTQQLKQVRASGLLCEKSLMAGDRASDLVAAKANKMAAAGVLWGYGSEGELAAEQPNVLLQTPHCMRQLRSEFESLV